METLRRKQWLGIVLLTGLFAPVYVGASAPIGYGYDLVDYYESLSGEFAISDHTIIIGYSAGVVEGGRTRLALFGSEFEFIDEPFLNNGEVGVTLHAVVLDRSGKIVFHEYAGAPENVFIPGHSRSLVAGPITFVSDSGGFLSVGNSVRVDAAATNHFAADQLRDSGSAIVLGFQYPFDSNLYAENIFWIEYKHISSGPLSAPIARESFHQQGNISLSTAKLDASVGAGRGSASVGTGKASASVGTGRGSASVGTGKASASVGTGRGSASVGTGKASASLGTGRGNASVATGIALTERGAQGATG